MFRGIVSETRALARGRYKALLYNLPGIAGLSGATLRIPNSFMIMVAGGRNVITGNALCMLVGMFMVGTALANPDVSFVTLLIAAVLTGAGGGAFAYSMSNCAFFWPQSKQGLALGLNAGLGNLGVSVMQLFMPMAMAGSMMGGDPLPSNPVPLCNLQAPTQIGNGTLFDSAVMQSFSLGADSTPAHIGVGFDAEVFETTCKSFCNYDQLVDGEKAPALASHCTSILDPKTKVPKMADDGTVLSPYSEMAPQYLYNGGWMWVPPLLFFLVLSFVWMNNMPQHDVGNCATAWSRYLFLQGLGYLCSIAAVILLIVSYAWFDSAVIKIVRIFVMVLVASVLMMTSLKHAPKLVPAIGQKIDNQFLIFKSKHTWAMTYLYIMTFGSFIGFSGAFPKLILDLFGYVPDPNCYADGTPLDNMPDDYECERIENPDAPSPSSYAWLGPFLGSVIRVFGGWASDQWSGSRVTEVSTIILTLATFICGFVCLKAKNAHPDIELGGNGDEAQDYFVPFFLCFMTMFTMTGIGNGSTFKMVPPMQEWVNMVEKKGGYEDLQTNVTNPKDFGAPVLGFISAIAAYGGFFIPSIFGVAVAEGGMHWALWGFGFYYFTCLLVNWHFYTKAGRDPSGSRFDDNKLRV